MLHTVLYIAAAFCCFRSRVVIVEWSGCVGLFTGGLLYSCVVKRQRKTVCGPPVSARDGSCCLLGVTCSETGKPENAIQKRSSVAKPSANSAQRRLSSRIYRNFELDVLLTPLSERRPSLFARPCRVVDGVSWRPSVVGSTLTPENSRLTPKAAELSSPRASVQRRISKNGKQLNDSVQLVPMHVSKNTEVSNGSVVSVAPRGLKKGRPLNGIVEEDVIESIVPLSEEVSGNCSLIPLQYLSCKSEFVDEDTEIDVCIRSFWDEGSDPETDNNVNVSFSFGSEQVSDDCRGGRRLNQKLKAAVNKQTGTAAKKCKVAKDVKTTISKQRALKNRAHKDSIRPQRKAESTHCKLCSKAQKGDKGDGSHALQSCSMTLRSRKKVDYVETSARSRKEKTPSPKIQRKTKTTGKRPSRKLCPKAISFCAARPIAARTRGRSSRTASPLLSSTASGQQGKPSGRTGRKYKPDQKRCQTSRKRIGSNASTKPPSKKQKLCDKAGVTGSTAQHARQANVRQAESRHVTRKQSKATRGTNSKNKTSVAQSVQKREATKQETRTRKLTYGQLTEDRTEMVASKSLTANSTNSDGDTVSSSVNRKKARSVDLLQYISVILISLVAFSCELGHPPFFTGEMPFLPPNQQCQSTEGMGMGGW